MKMPSYAVTGASGRFGRLAVAELLARGVPASDVVADVRSRAKAAGLADRGVRVRQAGYSRLGTLVAALAGQQWNQPARLPGQGPGVAARV
jgi:NAD(P)H dehydrogenase (quinone)